MTVFEWGNQTIKITDISNPIQSNPILTINLIIESIVCFVNKKVSLEYHP